MPKAVLISDTSGIAGRIYFMFHDSEGKVWNGSSFEAYVTANRDNYDVAVTEQGTASKIYTADVPALIAGMCRVTAWLKPSSGATVAETDTPLDGAEFDWAGANFASMGQLELDAGTAQAGAAGTITLRSGASSVDAFYVGTNYASCVKITKGTGIGQVRKATGYVGATRVLTVTPNWVTNPDNTSEYVVLGLIA